MNRRRMMMTKGWDGIVYKEGETGFREPFTYKASDFYGEQITYVRFLNSNWYEKGVHLGCSGTGDIHGITIGPVNFANFKTLKIEWEETVGNVGTEDYFYCGYSAFEKEQGKKVDFAAKERMEKSGIITLDISSVSGKKYIAFEWNKNGIGIKNILLE